MRAIVTVVGKDMVGILSKVSSICAEKQMNIIEVSQSILQEMFCMIMLVETKSTESNFVNFSEELVETGKKMGLVIHAMHEDVFNTMHHI